MRHTVKCFKKDVSLRADSVVILNCEIMSNLLYDHLLEQTLADRPMCAQVTYIVSGHTPEERNTWCNFLSSKETYNHWRSGVYQTQT